MFYVGQSHSGTCSSVDARALWRSIQSSMTFRDLDPEAAHAELQADKDLRILDVRTADEHQSHRLPDALLIPIQEIQQRVDEIDPKARWLVMCEHGVRSQQVCEFLTQMGYAEVTNLRGGLAHWAACGLPVDS